MFERLDVKKGEDSRGEMTDVHDLDQHCGVAGRADKTKMSDRQDERRFAGVAAGFVEVGPVDGLPPGMAMKAAVGGGDLSVVNADGRIVAVGDLCVRCGSSLSSGRTCGTQLTCSACGWGYDLDRGCVVGLPALRIETHEVRVDGGRIFVSEGALPARIA